MLLRRLFRQLLIYICYETLYMYFVVLIRLPYETNYQMLPLSALYPISIPIHCHKSSPLSKINVLLYKVRKCPYRFMEFKIFFFQRCFTKKLCSIKFIRASFFVYTMKDLVINCHYRLNTCL